jgi:hypothetical protein
LYRLIVASSSAAGTPSSAARPPIVSACLIHPLPISTLLSSLQWYCSTSRFHPTGNVSSVGLSGPARRVRSSNTTCMGVVGKSS